VSIEQDFAMVREGLHSPMTYADDEEEQAALSRIEAEYETAMMVHGETCALVEDRRARRQRDALKAALEKIAEADFITNTASVMARQALEELEAVEQSSRPRQWGYGPKELEEK
jgi:hypothetical protein